MLKKKAVFLDRDGTLIEDMGYGADVTRLRFLPGALEAVQRLNRAGYAVVIVTNQSGVARGLFSEDELEEFNRKLILLAREHGARINGIYYCPHHPEGKVPIYTVDCRCRKPKPGLLLRAAEALGINLRASFAIGNMPRDVEAGRRAGCRTIFIESGAAPETQARAIASDFTTDSLSAAVDIILEAPALEREEKMPEAAARTCANCGKEITDEDLASGAAIEEEGDYLCPECVPKEEAPAPEASRLEEILRQIQIDLKNLSTHLTYEKFSIWNVLGGIAQGGALLAMSLAFLSRGSYEQSHALLLWAVAAQLLALTCFLKAR